MPQQRTPIPRPSTADRRRAQRTELREELTRIERDMRDLENDFGARIKPLSRAYISTLTRLRRLQHVDLLGEVEARAIEQRQERGQRRPKAS